ncbi:hypothetical protein N657DRAFT_602987 [Parathielavia appendiculata]|uniref:Zn(2)-C6 fungal-type domain-containing protein n=1 Tax=Parathielavia appendiculata TaxID=2587402 RepID=A0AAN6TTG4_9PEZI|nr:hypothetical protein N657DRAFT_602987 [Parathielavia appendiculata]
MQPSDRETDRFHSLHSDSQTVVRRRREPSKLQGPWRCANCPREFAQKEYRYKHQQRCIQASNRPKHSKQKSCVACAASKLRCDLGTPSCSRCLSRGKPCQYISLSSAQKSGPDRPENHVLGTTRDLYLPDITDDFGRVRSQAISLIGSDNAADVNTRDAEIVAGLEIDFNMRASTNSTQQGAANNTNPQSQQRLQRRASTLRDAAETITNWPMDANFNGVQVPNPSETPKQGSITGTSLTSPGGPSLTSPGWSRIQPFGVGAAGSRGGSSSSRWHLDNDSWASRSPLLTSEIHFGTDMEDDFLRHTPAMSTNNDMNFDLLGSMGILKRHRIDTAQLVQSPQGSAKSGLSSNAAAVSYFQQAAAGGLAPVAGTTSTAQKDQHMEDKTLHDAVTSTTASRPSAWPTSCPFHKLNSDDALVKIIRSYPRVMVRPGCYPPFVHHKLYRCGAGDIAEPLARAFCCVGAFYASVPTSEDFVYSMISEESRRLVQRFHRPPGSDSDVLAMVHAMCIYQIIGFFASTNPEHARATELHHSFFLKMTRLLIRQYLQDLSPSEVNREMAWRKWIVNETIRRTVFLVNAINTLSCRVQKQGANFFEALDDDLVRNMALPASDQLWKASSAEEWLVVRDQLGPDETASGRLTVQQAIDHFFGPIQQGDSSRLRMSYAQFAQLDEFTQLVVATAGNVDHQT